MNDIKLSGIADFKRASLGQTVEANLRDFFNWGCVRAGGFVEVEDGQCNAVSREGRTDYTTYKSEHPFWCYEADSTLSGMPTLPDGVTVDGVFYPTASTTGQYEHSFDYKKGLISFPTPLLTSSGVHASYSYRLAPFVRCSEPWFNQLYLNGWAYEQEGKDSSAILNEYGLSTPIVIVQYSDEHRSKGMYMGSSAAISKLSVLFHVFATDSDEQKRLAEIVAAQAGRTIPLYDLNARVDADDFELDYKNSPRSGKSNYREAVNTYPYGKLLITSTNSFLQPPRRSLFFSTIKVDGEMRLENI